MINDAWTEKWNERYANEAFAYGEQPNTYLDEQLSKLAPGKILFAAEGEGRNAVYAARQGWATSAFDISVEGRKKALKLADTMKVEIDYRLGELEQLSFSEQEFDVIALIYAHFPAAVKSTIHKQLDKYLKIGGFIIFEAFSKNHLSFLARNERVGGPKDIESLFSLEEIKVDFKNYEFQELAEKVILLNEGLYHNGEASVIRFFARKVS